MENEGNVHDARKNFIENRFTNLDELLKSRYHWMNEYLDNKRNIIEVGAGASFSKFYINKPLTLTDTVKNSWTDEKVDATNMPFENSTIDIIIASHCIHHMYSPIKFFKECSRVLKRDGLILIQEINTSLLMRCLLRVNRHEGWSYDVNVFDENSIANDPNDIWSANCAIPELLFANKKLFEEKINYMKIIRNDLNEFLLFPLSGGVIAKKKMIELPRIIFPIIKMIDKILVFLMPSVFALGRSVVIKNIK